jgi:hypothetical protein
MLVNSLIECLLIYEKNADDFSIKSVKFSVSNGLAIITKFIDFIFVYSYASVYLLIAYANEDYSSAKPVISYVDYKILVIIAYSCFIIYIILVTYHKKDFENGSLGQDDFQRTLNFRQFKFYTTTTLFLLGSTLANSVISVGLNSFICNDDTD